MEQPLVNVEELLKKIVEERKQQEIQFHKERVAKLIQEKVELELRLYVVNKTLEEINEAVKNTPFLQEWKEQSVSYAIALPKSG